MFTNCDSSSFKYRETDDEKELPLEGNTIIKNLVRGNEEELTLYVETDKKRKKDDVCCVIYWCDKERKVEGWEWIEGWIDIMKVLIGIKWWNDGWCRSAFLGMVHHLGFFGSHLFVAWTIKDIVVIIHVSLVGLPVRIVWLNKILIRCNLSLTL